MIVNVLPATKLTDSQLARWSELQGNHNELRRPCFCPEFTLAVASVRERIEVALLQEDDEIVGVLPFHRSRRNVAQSIAEGFSGFQGLICDEHRSWDAEHLVRMSGLKAWRFECALASQKPLAPFRLREWEAPYMDLSNGFEAYRVERRRNRSDELQEALRKSRKIEREIGTLEFSTTASDDHTFETLLGWKRDQLKARGLPDCFAPAWAVPLLRRIVHANGDQFSGMLVTMHVGGELSGANIAMRHGPVLHGYITAFNRKFYKYSPGLIMIAKLAQAADSLGIQRIDMGAGDESFKRSFASGSTVVAKGSIELQPFARALHAGLRTANELIDGTAFADPARQFLRRMRRLSQAR